MNTTHWKNHLNNCGLHRTPCLFIIDYKGENGRVFPLSQLPNDIAFSFAEEKKIPRLAPKSRP